MSYARRVSSPRRNSKRKSLNYWRRCDPTLPPPKYDELQSYFGGGTPPGAEGSRPSRTRILLLIGGFDTTCDASTSPPTNSGSAHIVPVSFGSAAGLLN